MKLSQSPVYLKNQSEQKYIKLLEVKIVCAFILKYSRNIFSMKYKRCDWGHVANKISVNYANDTIPTLTKATEGCREFSLEQSSYKINFTVLDQLKNLSFFF